MLDLGSGAEVAQRACPTLYPADKPRAFPLSSAVMTALSSCLSSYVNVNLLITISTRFIHLSTVTKPKGMFCSMHHSKYLLMSLTRSMNSRCVVGSLNEVIPQRAKILINVVDIPRNIGPLLYDPRAAVIMFSKTVMRHFVRIDGRRTKNAYDVTFLQTCRRYPV